MVVLRDSPSSVVLLFDSCMTVTRADHGFSQRIAAINARADESALGAINRPLQGQEYSYAEFLSGLVDADGERYVFNREAKRIDQDDIVRAASPNNLS